MSRLNLTPYCLGRILLPCAVGLGLCGIYWNASAASDYPIARISNDHMGESLKRFRSIHKPANCTRGPAEGFDEKKRKFKFSPWIVCGVRIGVTFEGQELLDKVNPGRPFGMWASFYDKRLVELNYTLAISSMDSLVPLLESQFGQPAHITHDDDGKVSFVSWIRHGTQMEISVVPIGPAMADEEFLHVGVGEPSRAVQVRLSKTIGKPSP